MAYLSHSMRQHGLTTLVRDLSLAAQTLRLCARQLRAAGIIDAALAAERVADDVDPDQPTLPLHAWVLKPDGVYCEKCGVRRPREGEGVREGTCIG